MRLRGGKVLGETEDLIYLYDEEGNRTTMCSLITQPNGQKQYESWPCMDMIGLAERLPALTADSHGADKWIMALEETTAGIQLALGDVKALLTYVAGKQITQEIFTEANVGAAIGNNYSDDVDFGHCRSKVWRQLRKHYPAKRDPSKLEGETLGENECPSKFLHTFQKKWKEETGEAWNANKTTQSLFKMMVKKAMPESVQRRLEDVVGLMKMDWPLFSEHIVHHVELYRKDRKKKDEEDKQLVNKLTQLQLGELSKLVKKEKEESKVHAPMVAATQAAPPTIQPQAPLQPPPIDPNAMGKETSANTTHHHYYYQQIPRGGGNQQTPRGRGRGGPGGNAPSTTFRGGWKGGRNYIPGNHHAFQDTPNQQPGPPHVGAGYPGANPAPPDNQCWGCGQPGHIQAQCPSNPWEGPAQNWPNMEQPQPW
ncbi:hypothetical protein ABVT39_007187 [Epinephelus coioides]